MNCSACAHENPDRAKFCIECGVRVGSAFHRIEALAEVDGRMKVIDMKNYAFTEDVMVAKDSPVEMYRSSVAVDYDPE